MKIKALIASLVVFILLGGIVHACRPQQPVEPASVTQTDKYDGDCTGNETAGRCADKFVCPDDTIPVDEPNHICAPQPQPAVVQPPVVVTPPVVEEFHGK